jgi:uncharacterized protein (TIGR03435 family)
VRRAAVCSVIFAAAVALAQSPATVAFEVASVKTVLLGGAARRVTGGPGTNDPTRFTYLGSMWAILQAAFGVKGEQLDQLPEWTRERRFEIDANVPPDATKEQLKIMMQNLLKERFDLAFHLTKKEIDAYTLVVAKGGPKLKPAAPPDAMPGTVSRDAEPGTLDQDGFPQLPPGYTANARAGASYTTGSVRMTFRKSSPADLIRALGRGVIPISDQTGLTGPYDFKLEYDPESLIRLLPIVRPFLGSPPDPSNAPDISTALEKQLGLTLRKEKTQVDVVVIDHINKEPKPN